MPDTYAPAAQAQPAPLLATRIDIALAGYNAKGILWRVEHAGQVTLERTRVPALDACRHLLAAGVTGKLGMYRKGILQLTVDIETGARCTVTDSPTRSLVLERYKAFSRDGEEEGPGSIG